MKRLLPYLTALLVLAGCVNPSRESSVEPEPAIVGSPGESVEPPPPPPPDTERAEWLLARVKALADRGVLFEPDRVAKMLSLTFHASEPETRGPFTNCENPYDGSSMVQSYTAQEPNWYGATSEGVPHMLRPGFLINPTAVIGDPAFSYRVTRHKSCTGRKEPKEYTDARITFDGASGYACITPQILNSVLPEAKRVNATDGFVPYYYSGKSDDKSGTTIQFSFFITTRCLISIDIDQSDKTGKRFLRAQSKFQMCKLEVERGYCSDHGPFSWGDGSKFDAMEDLVFETCGTLESYVQKEPFSGEEPAPLPPGSFHSGPCP